MLELAVIGVGADWEERYRPVLQKLRNRLRVRTVYAAVNGRAEAAAAEFGGDVAPGLLALVERPDVRGILLLEPSWYSATAARFACERGKPVFMTGCTAANNGTSRDLQRLATEKGITVMPALGRRYTPATVRLRELMASRLGTPQRIAIDAEVPVNGAPHAPLQREVLVELLDWCRNLLGISSVALRSVIAEPSAEAAAKSAGTRELSLDFGRHAAGGDAVPVNLRLRSVPHSSSANGNSAPRLRFDVWCAEGIAVLEDATRIVWEQGGIQVVESLASERSDVEVMFDLFSRRVVGGLIPVPTLDDVHEAQRLAETLGQFESS